MLTTTVGPGKEHKGASAFLIAELTVYIPVSVTSTSLAMVHMPATGVSGVDLWAEDPRTGAWRWVFTSAPSSNRVCTTMIELPPSGTPGGVRPTKWLLYFPTYNGVSGLRIGVNEGEALEPCAGTCSSASPKPEI